MEKTLMVGKYYKTLFRFFLCPEDDDRVCKFDFECFFRVDSISAFGENDENWMDYDNDAAIRKNGKLNHREYDIEIDNANNIPIDWEDFDEIVSFMLDNFIEIQDAKELDRAKVSISKAKEANKALEKHYADTGAGEPDY